MGIEEKVETVTTVTLTEEMLAEAIATSMKRFVNSVCGEDLDPMRAVVITATILAFSSDLKKEIFHGDEAE